MVIGHISGKENKDMENISVIKLIACLTLLARKKIQANTAKKK